MTAIRNETLSTEFICNEINTILLETYAALIGEKFQWYYFIFYWQWLGNLTLCTICTPTFTYSHISVRIYSIHDCIREPLIKSPILNLVSKTTWLLLRHCYADVNKNEI